MRARYFFGLAILAVIIGLVQVGVQQRHASSLADTIVSKDQSAADTTVEQKELEEYTEKHMGASTTVFLKGSYERAKTAAEAAANPASNGQVYAQAQTSCAGRADSVTQARCVQSYVATHAAPSANPQAVAMPKTEDYTRTFSSPGWTPDGAGVALMLTTVGVAMGIYLMLLRRIGIHE